MSNPCFITVHERCFFLPNSPDWYMADTEEYVDKPQIINAGNILKINPSFVSRVYDANSKDRYGMPFRDLPADKRIPYTEIHFIGGIEKYAKVFRVAETPEEIEALCEKAGHG